MTDIADLPKSEEVPPTGAEAKPDIPAQLATTTVSAALETQDTGQITTSAASSAAKINDQSVSSVTSLPAVSGPVVTTNGHAQPAQDATATQVPSEAGGQPAIAQDASGKGQAGSPTVQAAKVMPPPSIFALEIAYLIALLAGAVAYSATTANSALHQLFPTTLFNLVPLAIPWFGALGAVVIGLYGVFDHKTDWDNSFLYWHIARPVTGAVLGVIGYLIFHAVVQTAGGPATNSNAVVYDIVAFLVGYREETFKLLIKRATDLILGPGDTPQVTGTSPTASVESQAPVHS
jgi:hypothetical protein